MYGIHIDYKHPFKADFIAVYPSLEFVQACIETCTGILIPLGELHGTFVASEVYKKTIDKIEVTVTEVDRGIIDICNNPTIRVRKELLGGSL